MKHFLRRKFSELDPKNQLPFEASKASQSSGELGFGVTVTEKIRFLKKDGSFNVRRKGLAWWQSLHWYDLLITMNWWKFLCFLIFIFISVNALFALLYLQLGSTHFAGIEAEFPLVAQFFEFFFFSVQTFATVGYGRVNPLDFEAGMLSSVESLVGLLMTALATGLLFARFARPTAKIIYSQQAVIAPYQGGRAFELRIVNGRSSALTEVEAQLTVSMLINRNGKTSREFHALGLERSKINFFPLSWTIVHPIQEDSPLHTVKSWEELHEAEVEFMLIIKAYDDSFAQEVYSRHSYIASEIVWGAKYVSMFHPEGKEIVLELDQLDKIEKVALPFPEYEHKSAHYEGFMPDADLHPGVNSPQNP
jgi:inward rectifier potassium channel